MLSSTFLPPLTKVLIQIYTFAVRPELNAEFSKAYMSIPASGSEQIRKFIDSHVKDLTSEELTLISELGAMITRDNASSTDISDKRLLERLQNIFNLNNPNSVQKP